MDRTELSHFDGKSPLEHIQQKRTEEVHGSFLSPLWFGFLEAVIATAFLLVLLQLLLPEPSLRLLLLGGVAIALALGGRQGWLAWRRLERLHRLLEQERYEITHHRPQEREELVALYASKGFSPPLLDQVVDFLMADDDRLLKVMLEEEMGLNLASESHPLQYLAVALGGALLAISALLIAFLLHPFATIPTVFLLVLFASWIAAGKERNDALAGVIWALAILGLSLGATLFLFHFWLQ